MEQMKRGKEDFEEEKNNAREDRWILITNIEYE